MSQLCDATRSQLLILDIQERLAGAMPAEDMAQLTRNSGRLLQAAALLEVPVLRSEQYPRGLGETVQALRDLLPPGMKHFEKTSFSCCGADGFNLAAGQREQIIICGMETHVCVLQTALELSGSGRQVFVVEDAVVSRDPVHKVNALARMRQAGVIITNHESVLFEWLRNARHEHFKAISALLK